MSRRGTWCNRWLLKHTKHTWAQFPNTESLTFSFWTGKSRWSATFWLRTCEGVHERGQGPVEHLEKRVPAGITSGAAQHRVLQDVWDAGAVHGSGPELDTGACEAEIRERDRRDGPEGYGVYLKRLLESSLAA